MGIVKKQAAFLIALLLLLSLSFSETGVVSAKTKKSSEKQTENKKEKTEYPYLIQVNKATNTVTIFAKDENGKYKKPVKAMVCSGGEATPIGTFKSPNKYRWQPLMNNVWGQYCTRIYGNFLFHSVYYMSRNPGDLSVSAYNALGTTASHGCVRLTCGDAKWMYDNCPLGTTIKIINGTKKDDPLGKPKAMKISTKWDPTDPTPGNPWHNQLIKVTAKRKTIEYGKKIKDLKSLVTLTDVTGRNVNKETYLKVSGSINTKKLGNYDVVYKTTDKAGRYKEKTVSFSVVDTKKPVFSGLDAVTLERNASFNPLKGVKANMVSGQKLKKEQIKVKGTVKTNKCGVYKLTYKVKGTNKKTAAKTRTVKVVDTKKPELNGVNDTSLTQTFENETQCIEAIKADVMAHVSIKDNGQKIAAEKVASMILLGVNKTAENTYQVTVTVTDAAKNTTKKMVTYTVQPFVTATPAA